MLTIFQTPTKLDLMRYVFIYGGMTISWKSIKQIMETCGLPSIRDNATKLIMLHALHRLKNDTLKVIELSISSKSFTFINSRRVMKLLFDE